MSTDGRTRAERVKDVAVDAVSARTDVEELRGHRERTNRVLSAVVRAIDAGAEAYAEDGLERLEFTEAVFARWYLAEVERIAARASQSPERHARPEGDTGDGHEPPSPTAAISALQDGLIDIGRRALFARTYDAPRIDQALIDISTDLARIAQHDIPAIREQAVREERERLAAVFTERAERAGTADLRRHMQIAARVAAPELTPEEITQAIRDGNYTVCHVPEDPAQGEGR